MNTLETAVQLQQHAAKVGFDWPTVQGIFDKIQEELLEVEEAYAEGNTIHLQEEIGDLFFSVINLARFLKIDPDRAIQHSTKKFSSRFRFIEEALAATPCLSEQQLNDAWKKAKDKVKHDEHI